MAVGSYSEVLAWIVSRFFSKERSMEAVLNAGLFEPTFVLIVIFFFKKLLPGDSVPEIGLLVPLAILWLLIQWSTMRLAAV